MKHTATAADHADEAFGEFAQALSRLVQGWSGREADIEAQLAELRKILVEGAQAREQSFAGLLGAWRELAEMGTSIVAPIAAFHADDAGLARDLQAQAGELQHASDAFAALLAPLPAEAFARFAQTARTRVAQGSPFESVKAVYDAWIESSEAAYSRLAHTREFASAQSRLSRASLRVRAAQIALIESGARHLGLPTRADLDALHHQLHELRRELDALRARTPRRRTGVPKPPARKSKAARKRAPARRR